MREEILRILKSLLGDQVNFAVTLQNRKKKHLCLFKNILCESCFERNFKIIISDFCPFYTKFNIYWERTALNEIVARNCSEVDPELGGRKMF